MTLRSSMLALVVLLVALGAVFALANDAGVQTHVFLPDPTATPSPTPLPTMTPMPAGSADNWGPANETTYLYKGEAEGEGTISIDRMNFEEFLMVSGLEAPPEDDPYPLLTLQKQLRDILEEGAQQLNLQLAPFGITGPSIELIGGVPVAMLHVRAIPQTLADGREYEGQEMVFAWAQSGEDIVRADLNFKGAPSETMYNDYRAWLEEHMPELVSSAAENTDETATGQAAPAEGEDTGESSTDQATEAAPNESENVDQAPSAETDATPEATQATEE